MNQEVAKEISRLTVALTGNPNAGKTTIFNNLTGARQRVGNYPGVTVEKKEGTFDHEGKEISVVDLPGTYSLTANSLEERVARDYLIQECPDVVVQVLDASCLERNLFLAVQLLELELNLVLCLNMVDVAREKGLDIDVHYLSQLLGVPIVETVGSASEGMDTLLSAMVEAAANKNSARTQIKYGREIGEDVDKLVAVMEEETGEEKRTPPLGWLAIKLLEQDPLVRQSVEEDFKTCDKILKTADDACASLEELYGDPSEIIIADRRYGFISGACQEAVELSIESRHRFSDRLDDILAHRVLGIPIFLAVIYAIFWLTFTLGGPPMELIESSVQWFGSNVAQLWPKASDSMFRSLLVDGIIGGVGGVLVFLPNIVLLFMGISFLEDTGYIARAAFLTDWMMHKIGLHGRSFIPMVVGFGCSVPGIMATRTLESRRDRLTTMLVLPLMSCSARFPIYTLIIPAFFPPAYHAPVLWCLYLLGISLAVGLAKLLRSTILAGESIPFVMELPLYRLPTLRGVLIHMWERAKLYVAKAGTIILVASILLWMVQTYPIPKGAAERESKAIAAAERVFQEELNKLGRRVLTESQRQPIISLLQSEHELEECRRDHYEHEKEFIKKKDTLAALRKGLKENKVLQEFFTLRKELLKTHRDYEAIISSNEEVADAKEIRRATLLARAARDSALERLAKKHQRLFPLVVQLLNGVEEPFQEAIAIAQKIRRREELDYSLAGRTGNLLEPVLKPIGFDNRVATALIGAFAAKEIFVAQMGIVAAVDTEEEGLGTLRTWLRKRYRPLVGISLLIFCLIATPCVATISATKKESGSWKWALLQLGGLTVIAYVLCLIVYQVGSLLGF